MKRSFFEWNGPAQFGWSSGQASGAIQQERRWRGPYLRLGRFRFKVERIETRYKVESVPDRTRWYFSFYYDKRSNTFEGDRTIFHDGQRWRVK